MGAVYLAEDTKLHRRIALKVLPPEVASDADRLARFRREAQAVAALNHPHIVTLHSVEEDRGIHFLTMELIEGESLDRAIPRGGLPLPRLFDIGIGLADALAAAHEKGIVHRDVKPSNVMVARDGRVKVLDFGLAKLAPGTATAVPAAARSDVSDAPTETVSDDRPLTQEGLVIGTLPYMSPEQLDGQPVDARTDIFSLGVVLYEMATGRLPFGGRTWERIASSIRQEAPSPVTEIRSGLPRHLGRIIQLCLEKEPDARFQTAKDVRNELRVLRQELGSADPKPSAAGRRALRGALAAVSVIAAALLLLLWRERGRLERAKSAAPASSAAGATEAVEPRAIAVLPFVNMSSDPEQDYFSDGISEELLNLLSRIPELRVAARTSSFAFKGKTLEIPVIARQLRVAHVIEGSVRKSGDRVRITAQLIRAADGFHVWSETYDRTLDDIFRIQDEIAAAVAQQLRVTLLGTAPKARTTAPRAYALYLQAVQLGRQKTPEAFAQSDVLFRQVLEIDPRYAPAWIGLSYNAGRAANMGLIPFAAGAARAREATEKALAIDPDLAPAYASLGMASLYIDRDLAGAAKRLTRALELDPKDPEVLGSTNALLTALGRVGEKLALQEEVVRRDPVNVLALDTLGVNQYLAGRFDESIATYHLALSLSPGYTQAHYHLGCSLLLKGDAAGALSEMEQETNEAWRMIGLPLAHHALGRKEEADASLAALVAAHERDSAYNIAYVHAFRGEADRAFEWLDKAVEYRDTALAEILVDPLLSRIHTDPRWLPFLRRIGRAPEQIANIEFTVTPPER